MPSALTVFVPPELADGSTVIGQEEESASSCHAATFFASPSIVTESAMLPLPVVFGAG